MTPQKQPEATTIVHVPLGRIRRDDAQSRGDLDPEKLEELVASVKAVGILEPLELRPDPEAPQHFIIVYGERRWRAARLAGLLTVPAVVNTEARQLKRRQLYENVMRADLNLVELASNIASVMQEENLDTKTLAEQLHWPLRKVQRLVEIHEAPSVVKTAIVKGLSNREGTKMLSQRHALDLVRAYRHYGRADTTEGKEDAARRIDRLVGKVVDEDWSVDRLQEYVAALGRTPRRDPLDRSPREPKARSESASAPGEGGSTVNRPAELASRQSLPLYESKGGRFTVFVHRAKECQDAEARTALADALRKLVADVAL